MIVSIENPKESTKTPKPNKWVQQGQEYKINLKAYITQSAIFKETKYLGLNVTKYVQDWYARSYKTLMKEIKKFTCKNLERQTGFVD